MNLFQEITESRMLRRLEQFQGKKVRDIAESLFEHLLALQILAHDNPKTAARYADSVMQQAHFDGFRITQPDLYNLIVMILQQDKYSDRLLNDRSIVIPELRLKRNLREIASGRIDNDDFSQLMMTLQYRISGLNNQLVSIRRAASEWDRLSPKEKDNVRNLLKQQMRTYSIDSDLFQIFR